MYAAHLSLYQVLLPPLTTECTLVFKNVADRFIYRHCSYKEILCSLHVLLWPGCSDTLKALRRPVMSYLDLANVIHVSASLQGRERMCLPLHVWLTLVFLIWVSFVIHVCLLLDMCILSTIVGLFAYTDCCMPLCVFIIWRHLLHVSIGLGIHNCANVEELIVKKKDL